MNSDERKNGSMDNIGERYKDRLADQSDFVDGISAFREETQERMLDLHARMNELELSLEESIQNIRDYLESAKKKS